VLATLALAAACGLGGPTRLEAAPERVVDVSSVEELRRAAGDARPGTRIRLAPGTYAGGIHLTGLAGAAGRPIVFVARDPANPPVIDGGGSGLHLTDAVHVEVDGLAFRGQRGNGVNVDDGGSPDSPTHHVTLRRLQVRDVGPNGNCDGIKLSGLQDLRVEDCTVERWGLGGSAVDLVGCLRGTIQGNTFRHGPTAAGASGVQMKGGSAEILVRSNRFEHAGGRAVNAGGSTGLQYFRPPLETWKGPKHEARALTIEGNTFLASQAPVAFVGVDGAVFRFNTVYRPERWALRILQETREEGFVPCRNVEVRQNLIVFTTDRWGEGGVNVGAGTEPTSFRFVGNHWYAQDAPTRTRASVRLPTPEQDGAYGEDPLLRAPEAGDLTVKPGSPAALVGAHALPK
jgi:hypothetical protein